MTIIKHIIYSSFTRHIWTRYMVPNNYVGGKQFIVLYRVIEYEFYTTRMSNNLYKTYLTSSLW